jgi:hypothetical protein
MTTLNSVPSGLLSTVDATGTLNIQTNSVNALAIDTNQNATMNYVSAQNTFGFKNRIINGAMVIDQRNAGASVTPTADTYLVDRWQFNQTQVSKFSFQQNAGSVTSPIGFTNYLGATVVSAYSIGSNDIFDIRQAIEGFNIADLGWGTANAKTVTLSFQVYSSLTGTFGGVVANGATSYCYPFTYSIPVANTWTPIAITITGPTSGTFPTNNAAGAQVRFGLGVGSTYSGTAGSWSANVYVSATGATSVVGTSGATFYITGVQLEKGSIATPFEYRQYGQELALCQRYYTTLPSQNGTATGTGRTLGTCNGNNIAIAGNLFFPVSMRTAPTITIYGNASTTGNFNFYSAGSGAQATYTGSASSSTIANSSSVGFGLNMVVASLPASYSGWSDFSFSVGNFGISFTINAEL